jgi:hypothetical protein
MTRRNDLFPYFKTLEDGCTAQIDISAFPEDDRSFILEQLKSYNPEINDKFMITILLPNQYIANTVSHDLNSKYFDRSTVKATEHLKSMGLHVGGIGKIVYPGMVLLTRPKDPRQRDQFNAYAKSLAGNPNIIIDD